MPEATSFGTSLMFCCACAAVAARTSMAKPIAYFVICGDSFRVVCARARLGRVHEHYRTPRIAAPCSTSSHGRRELGRGLAHRLRRRADRRAPDRCHIARPLYPRSNIADTPRIDIDNAWLRIRRDCTSNDASRDPGADAAPAVPGLRRGDGQGGDCRPDDE